MIYRFSDAKEQYVNFLNKPGSQKLLDGHLLINENDKTFAVGTDSYMDCYYFQSESYDNIDNISMTDGVKTRSIKIKDGDSGAAGALFGAMFFGPVGALAMGLATREETKYGEILVVENIGFTITYSNTSHTDVNVLNLCFNRGSIRYNSERDSYDKVKQLTIQIYEELYKRICPENKTESDTLGSAQSGSENSGMLEPANEMALPSGSININPDNVAPTITRIELFLEDKEWNKVTAYAETALDYFPTDYRLYLFLMFADLQVSDYDELSKCTKPITENRYYKKLVRFAGNDVIEKIQNYASKADEMAEKEATYFKAVQLMSSQEYAEAYMLFARLGDYKDAKDRAQKCTEKCAEYAVRKEQEQKKYLKREQQSKGIADAIDERNRLLEQFEKEMPGDKTIRNRIEALEDLLLQRAGIFKNTNDNYVFKGYVPPCGSNGKIHLLNENEWQLIGRTKDKILLLSKYYVRKHVFWDNNYLELNGGYLGDVFFPPMVSGFTSSQRAIINSLGLLSTEEAEKYLPDKSDRLLRDDEGTIIEWLLYDSASQNKYTGVNFDGIIMKGTRRWAVRPAMWIDLGALKPAVSIRFDDPDYERVDFEYYSLYIPKEFAGKVEATAYSQTITGSHESEITIQLAAVDPLDGKIDNVAREIADERKLFDNNSYHIVAWEERLDNKTRVALFYKAPDDFHGLYVKASYNPYGRNDIYDKLLRGFWNTERPEEKIREKEALEEEIDALLEKRRGLLNAVNKNTMPDKGNGDLKLKIDKTLLEKAGICQIGSSLKFTPFHNPNKKSDSEYFNSKFYCINEWQVIGRTKSKVLLLSKYSELHTYYNISKKCEWHESALYGRLNKRVHNDDKDSFIEHFDTKHIALFGELTILSGEEVMRLLPKQKDRILYTKDDTDAVEWFVRDDVKDGQVTIVNAKGECVKVKNTGLDSYDAHVRPAVWIDLNKIKEIL